MAIAYPNIPGVEFRDIPGTIGYCVGSDGSVWTRRGVRGLGAGRGTKAILLDTWTRKKPCPGKDGYPQVSVAIGPGKSKTRPIHRIVLSAFAGPKPPGMVARHINGNREESTRDNLAWGTPKENSADREAHGRTARGESSGQSKLTSHDVEIMRRIRLEWGVSIEQIGRLFRISKRQAGRIIDGKSWSASIEAPKDAPVLRTELLGRDRDPELQGGRA